MRWLAPAAAALIAHAALVLVPLPTREAAPEVRLTLRAAPPPAPQPPPPPPPPAPAPAPEPAPAPPAPAPRALDRSPEPPPPGPALGAPEAPAAPVEFDPVLVPAVGDVPMPPASAPPPPAPRPAPDEPDPDALRRYAAVVRARVHREKNYPAAAIRRRHEGVVLVRLSIAENGSLAAAPRLQRASGHPELDREGLRMGRAAAPYPAPPAGTSGPVSVIVPVRFSLAP